MLALLISKHHTNCLSNSKNNLFYCSKWGTHYKIISLISASFPPIQLKLATVWSSASPKVDLVRRFRRVRGIKRDFTLHHQLRRASGTLRFYIYEILNIIFFRLKSDVQEKHGGQLSISLTFCHTDRANKRGSSPVNCILAKLTRRRDGPKLLPLCGHSWKLRASNIKL